MTGTEYREAIKAWGMTQAAASTFFRVSPRLGRTWAKDGPSPLVAALIRLMQGAGITPAEVEEKYFDHPAA